jgi:hypothetical protein
LFENRAFSRVSGPETDDVAGGRRKLLSVGLPNLYSSPDIIRTFKSMQVRWIGHIARRVEIKKDFGWEAQKEGTIWKTWA